MQTPTPIARRGRYRLINCMMLLAWALLALPPACPAQQYVFDAYQQPQGLGNLSVQDMAFDKAGFLWVATANGLFRFLGSHFEHYGLKQGLNERNVQSVYVDPEGRVWVGTVDDLYLWDGMHFHPVSSRPIPIWLNHGMAALDRGRLLVISKGKLLSLTLDANGDLLSSKLFFSNEQRRRTPALDALTSLSATADGALWLGCGEML